jgi:hypothetical protein
MGLAKTDRMAFLSTWEKCFDPVIGNKRFEEFASTLKRYISYYSLLERTSIINKDSAFIY